MKMFTIKTILAGIGTFISLSWLPAAAQAPFPSIAPEVQAERDNARGQILRAELDKERTALAQAQQALAVGPATQALRDAVTRHGADVAALERELKIAVRPTVAAAPKTTQARTKVSLATSIAPKAKTGQVSYWDIYGRHASEIASTNQPVQEQ